jgi:hypothetical protein
LSVQRFRQQQSTHKRDEQASQIEVKKTRPHD